MLDIAWPEIVLIGAVALVAIGPKDLPKVMHTLGKWAGKARNFGHDIQRAFDQLSYESETAEKLKKEQEATSKADPPSPAPAPPVAADHDRPDA